MLRIVDESFNNEETVDSEEPVGELLMRLLVDAGIFEKTEGEFIVIFNDDESSALLSNEDSFADIAFTLEKVKIHLTMRALGERE